MKIGVVGSGLVGATAAYALVMRGIGREIVLVDANQKRAEAEADDIRHAVPFAHPLEVHEGQFSDLAGCRIVIIAAGVNQKPGETRLHLLGRNAAIFQEIVPKILKHAPESVLLVATNPVDIMTHMAAHFAQQQGFPVNRVLGSGTTLDTARFRTLLGNFLGVDAYHVHAYVVGEHGDSEVLTWSLIMVGGVSLQQFSNQRNIALNDQKKAEIDWRVRQAAYHIIEGKGATYYGIGSAIARIVNVILYDQRSVLTVCSPQKEVEGVTDVTISLPQLVGGQGVVSTLPIGLNEQEKKALNKSAQTVKDYIVELEKEY